ncbi:hypothetical protein SK803_20025 [Lentzea sp. BCCO 10_0856]|uniref:Secreted protein n=1 Tax=Lentzea miocenica TaxID=3095431 RepID=A0ABU4T2X3_9PSEU|nr:hypothetical protein [Lentzea sp. BCCO 10_0856]MDX8032507.1 hypothetical protein [Lentzea sp. BCCO 10_0856]
MRAKRTIAVISALLGLILSTAVPASAATGTWVPYGNDNPITGSASKWVCAASKTISTNVVAQVCAIRSPNSGDYVQGAVIVRNNRSSLFSTTASVEVRDRFTLDTLGIWECPSSGVGANSWSVCFGSTTHWLYQVYALGYAKGEYLNMTGVA